MAVGGRNAISEMFKTKLFLICIISRASGHRAPSTGARPRSPRKACGRRAGAAAAAAAAAAATTAAAAAA
eukprot:10206260-Heterocapsa_arctica.AAC.1